MMKKLTDTWRQLKPGQPCPQVGNVVKHHTRNTEASNQYNREHSATIMTEEHRRFMGRIPVGKKKYLKFPHMYRC